MKNLEAAGLQQVTSLQSLMQQQILSL
ncbi:hypothetical protein GBAR_LOCUS4666 [Geodia barretti]|uniref:Uncharacterized protein n=1 Tax=Geodia barretti TaxID=519541 RepID=A0AA35R9L2_GEOBA|nr:hypothetical protein GBAR_LOCUS4666 [Geodia barretti]